MPSPYLTGALQLREAELLSLWSACGAVARAVHHSESHELPRWAEPLRPVFIVLGLARWMFNALSRKLPRIRARSVYRPRLPTRDEQPGYWSYFDWLLKESERRMHQARVKAAS